MHRAGSATADPQAQRRVHGRNYKTIIFILHKYNVLQFLKWYGHLKRMMKKGLPRIFFEYTLRGPRPVGRPRVRWTDNMKKALEKRGMTLMRQDS